MSSARTSRRLGSTLGPRTLADQGNSLVHAHGLALVPGLLGPFVAEVGSGLGRRVPLEKPGETARSAGADPV
jgi:hypothetical protein